MVTTITKRINLSISITKKYFQHNKINGRFPKNYELSLSLLNWSPSLNIKKIIQNEETKMHRRSYVHAL